jgi:hypothetical protein
LSGVLSLSGGSQARGKDEAGDGETHGQSSPDFRRRIKL